MLAHPSTLLGTKFTAFRDTVLSITVQAASDLSLLLTTFPAFLLKTVGIAQTSLHPLSALHPPQPASRILQTQRFEPLDCRQTHHEASSDANFDCSLFDPFEQLVGLTQQESNEASSGFEHDQDEELMVMD